MAAHCVLYTLLSVYNNNNNNISYNVNYVVNAFLSCFHRWHRLRRLQYKYLRVRRVRLQLDGNRPGFHGALQVPGRCAGGVESSAESSTV